jgi:AbrB family looped-hinge helix DNA binding protein
MTSKGQVVIPAALRKKFGLKPGAELIIYEKNNEIVISSDAKAFIHQFVGILKGSNAGEFLVEERRKDRELEDKKLK